MKKTIINLLKWIGMILTLITMIVVVLYCVLFNFVDSPNLEKQMHEQYLSGKSEQYMNQISQQEKEAKLKQEYGLMWMNHVNKK